MSTFNRILLCYDTSREGRRALRDGAELAQLFKAETHLLAVLDNSRWSRGFDVVADVPFDVEEQTAKEILEDGVEKLKALGITAIGHFAIGNPMDRIPFFANALHVDLVVLGHHRSGTLARWWSGLDDGRLLDRVSCSMLIVNATERAGVREHDDVPETTQEKRSKQADIGVP
jgi:nucleotide-binding universal stress UspA family protein